MKSRILILSLAFFALCSFDAKAQIDATINPIGLLWGNLSIAGDYVISDAISVEGAIGFGSGDALSDTYKWRNIPVTVSGKYYFNPDDGADKFYTAAWLRYVGRKYEVEDQMSSFVDFTQTRLGLGISVGFKSVSRSGIVFDINFGAGRALVDETKLDSEGVAGDVDWPDIMFSGKLGIGYRFGS